MHKMNEVYSILVMELRPLLLQSWHQTQVPLLDLVHHGMLPNSIPIPRPKWGLNTRSAMEHPLTQTAFMNPIEVVFLRKEMIGNHDKSSRNTNRNRIFCYHHEVGCEPEKMIPRLATMRPPYHSKNTPSLKSITLFTQLLVKYPDRGARFNSHLL